MSSWFVKDCFRLLLWEISLQINLSQEIYWSKSLNQTGRRRPWSTIVFADSASCVKILQDRIRPFLIRLLRVSRTRTDGRGRANDRNPNPRPQLKIPARFEVMPEKACSRLRESIVWMLLLDMPPRTLFMGLSACGGTCNSPLVSCNVEFETLWCICKDTSQWHPKPNASLWQWILTSLSTQRFLVAVSVR